MQGLNAIRARGAAFAVAAAALAALVALVARGDLTPAAAGVGQFNAIEIETLDQPTYAQRPPGEPDLLAVTEKTGDVEMLRDEDVQAEPFLDLSDRVSDDGERGLLSIAFDPEYRKNRRFYVYYTDNDGDIRVDEFKRKKSNELQASAGSRRRVMRIPHPGASNHNGGTLHFGIVGSQNNAHQRPKLYLATGDGATQSNAADLTDNLLGKILRIEPFKRKKPNAPGYDIPRNNRFVGERGDDEIYAYGLRNPFRFSIDSELKTMAIGDVGEGTQEEINVCSVQTCGPNFGWPEFEGTVNHGGPAGPDPAKAPMLTYPHGSGGDAVTGGLIVHDPDLPSLDGKYLFADFYDGDVMAFTPDLANNEADGLAAIGVQILDPVSIVSANGGVAGQTYITALSGGVYRLEPVP